VSDDPSPIRVDVPSGSSLWRIAADLERAGVVRSARAFVVLARWRGVASKVRAGEYALAPSWGAERVLGELVAGRVVTYEVVLPEGLTAAEIAVRLEAATLVRADEFLAVARDPGAARELEVEGAGLEGYLLGRPTASPTAQQQVARVPSISSTRSGRRRRGVARLGQQQVGPLARSSRTDRRAGADRSASVFWNARTRHAARIRPDHDLHRRLTATCAANTSKTRRTRGTPTGSYCRRRRSRTGRRVASGGVRPAASEYPYFVARATSPRALVRRAPRQRGTPPAEIPLRDERDT
jgi:hypothetical protein